MVGFPFAYMYMKLTRREALLMCKSPSGRPVRILFQLWCIFINIVAADLSF